jgi:hypothetical protein
MALVTLVSVPIVFFLRKPKGPAPRPDPAHAVSE